MTYKQQVINLADDAIELLSEGIRDILWNFSLENTNLNHEEIVAKAKEEIGKYMEEYIVLDFYNNKYVEEYFDEE